VKILSLLGSTGSIGQSTLRVIRKYADELQVGALVCASNQQLLAEQVAEFKPELAVVTNELLPVSSELKKVCRETGTELQIGMAGAIAAATLGSADVIVAAILGAAGLRPTVEAIKAGKRVALANKEVMVLAGELITGLCQQHSAEIVPVDSEHSAIFQCLQGIRKEDLDTVLLCASGGPFRGKSKAVIDSMPVKAALNHPRWKMGQKITIDSATLMNKALEIIEARWLFNVTPDQISVIVHPQCIVHSMIECNDGTILAQMGQTDMIMPIQYAISYPERWHNDTTRISLAEIGSLDFMEPDREAFPSLDYAYAAMQAGGTAPVVLNAADEIAVANFLQGRISFGDIFRVIAAAMESAEIIAHPDLDDIYAADAQARELTEKVIVSLE